MSEETLVIVVHIPFRWDDRRFHRRRFAEALGVPLRGNGAVLVVEPYICPIIGWYRKTEREKLWHVLRQQAENLYVLTPFVWLPVRWQHKAGIEKLNRWMLAQQI